MPFVKGQSGNPSGRPKVIAEIRDLARQHTTIALNALVEIVKDKKAPKPARVSAAQTLLDRAYGKATQYVEANVNLLDTLSLDEQRALAAALAAISGSEGEGAGGTPPTHH